MRDHTKLRAFEMAFGSLRELHYQFDLANRLACIKETVFDECKLKLCEAKVLGALLRSMRSSRLNPSAWP